MRKTLARGCEELGVAMSPEQLHALLDYVRLIEKWNRTFNLTAIREPARMVELHLLDSIAVVPHLPRCARIADVGSGAGLPGIPIAIARPDVHVTLIDTIAKKTVFMQQAAAELKLGNVQVQHARVESFQLAEPADIVISRAFSELKDFVGASAHLLRPGGKLLAMKGLFPHEEMARLPASHQVCESIALKVPGVEGQRHLIVLSTIPQTGHP
ncbi:MAG: 16S rRNA (guanine(527)-N(7))-methyltransferase RsmG [Betaproteobacteria bacterium]|nr:16S rRNA (guanine(527)-N(7))-methyltransferase RsmG [Betaproteobacteria bacterium]